MYLSSGAIFKNTYALSSCYSGTEISGVSTIAVTSCTNTATACYVCIFYFNLSIGKILFCFFDRNS